jgi:hypothetical protein
MRVSLNDSIRWEMNFYDKNTYYGKDNFPKIPLWCLYKGIQSQK